MENQNGNSIVGKKIERLEKTLGEYETVLQELQSIDSPTLYTSLEELTEEQEKKNIETEYSKLEYPGNGNTTQKMVIDRICRNCAESAYKTDVPKEIRKEAYYTIAKTIIGAGIVAGAGLLELGLFSTGIGNGLVYNIITSPITLSSAYLATINFFNIIDINDSGNYNVKSIFGATGHYKFYKNWKKIKKMQDEGKIRQTKEVKTTKQELYYLNCFGREEKFYGSP